MRRSRKALSTRLSESKSDGRRCPSIYEAEIPISDSASYACNDVSRTSYTMSSGIVGSSLKRPRTLLESPVLTLPRFLLEVVLALFVGRSSGGKDVGRTEKKWRKKPFSPDLASWLAEVSGQEWHSPCALCESELSGVDTTSCKPVSFDEKNSRRAMYVVM